MYMYMYTCDPSPILTHLSAASSRAVMPASTIRSAQDRLSWRDLMLASTARTYAGVKVVNRVER